jgi:hypothetical protein
LLRDFQFISGENQVLFENIKVGDKVIGVKYPGENWNLQVTKVTPKRFEVHTGHTFTREYGDFWRSKGRRYTQEIYSAKPWSEELAKRAEIWEEEVRVKIEKDRLITKCYLSINRMTIREMNRFSLPDLQTLHSSLTSLTEKYRK